MKNICQKKSSDVCSSQDSILTIISKVLSTSSEAKILRVWHTWKKEADGLALTPPRTETSATAEQELSPNRTSRAAQTSPVCLTPTQVTSISCILRGIQSPCQGKPSSRKLVFLESY